MRAIGLQPFALRLLLGRDDEGRGAVVDLRELAAVTVPSFWNAGFSVGIFSSGAANGSSSASILTGSPFFCGTSTGTISAAKRPVFEASCARW